MSSAAVQQSQQYQQTTPTQRDRYSANPTAALSSSPPSSRRTARQSSGNGSLPNTPQQMQYSSPSSAMNASRGQGMPASSHASPSEPMSSSTYQQFYPDSAASGPPTALPIRTSSQQATTSATASPYDSRGAGSRYQQPSGGYGSETERERASDNERRQRTQRSPQADPGSAGRTQRSRQAPQQSRSATNVPQLPMDASLPRENSAIINHIVVDDPQADIARERARVAEAQPHQRGEQPGMVDQIVPADIEQKHRSRQEHLRQQPPHRKEVKFGDYILGQTLGEGEFGKVKMGWKKDSTVQVAIKLIRKESLQSNTTRLPKIYREIGILRDLQHPNIVRLHEFVETERHMGIILEYASGGELFDYILNHRYLKDPAARRLFAQLVSGVGYLHKKGIVHRDLKLENLLLDRNKNIIITDFGFANTFNPNDELPEEVEHRISDKDWVRREGFDKTNDKGLRRGDLMQTSCGSPCYAAPELVVSDGLYTGRKVDVWSCGVILYAMLAGYLPFDDDPANPEGDNINLLYKYIVSTPLTFPEYVSPHARDLLRRILVPDPRRRADLFEVARHSWLSEYSHVVGFIGSSTKSDRDIASSALQQGEEPQLGRSASVREPSSRSPAPAGGMPKQPPTNVEPENKPRDAKRRTVQLEYVAPKDATARGDTSPTAGAPIPSVLTGRTRARGDDQGPVEVPQTSSRDMGPPVPRKEVPTSSQVMPPPTSVRPGRDQVRAASDSPAAFSHHAATSASRPTTGGSIAPGRLASRGNSYSQPAVPTSTNANAQGHFSQPKSSSGYIISGPMQSDQAQESSRPTSQDHLAQYQQQSQPEQQPAQRGHKRSSTLGSIGDKIMGRSNSRRTSRQQDHPPNVLEKRDKRYPPVSMRNAIPNSNGDAQPRPSMESSRRTSFGFNRKNSEAPTETNSKRSSRRFSFLPNSFSMNSFGGGGGKKEQSPEAYQQRDARPESKGMAFGRGASRSPSRDTSNSTIPLYYDQDREASRNQQQQRRSNQPPASRDGRYEKALPPQPSSYASPPPVQRKQYRDDGYGGNLLDPRLTPQQPQEPVERYFTPTENMEQGQSQYNTATGGSYENPGSSYGQTAGQMRNSNRKFEQYDHGYGGSSSATRRVMDFFRRRGKDRSEA
ncbi:hypothetical protein LTR37_002016 [Vermiconidia calcicola]|uniref:Uncharacterized protein n=1 Tax=Vermiconidia calcicola TaxID=1690605 RepID=A0ACC3NUM8_9PEZI|nr:hypothetical protein LTR37_002016 [Vermiconidia calcicola]